MNTVLNTVRAQIIDISSGEVINEIHEGDRVRIFRDKKAERRLPDNIIELNKEEPFVKLYTRVLFDLSRSLTGTESQFVNYLMQYIRYSSGVLAHENGKTLTRNTMSKETELSLKTVDRLLKSLIEKQVIGRHKTGHYACFTANPFIFMRGQKVTETLVKLFEGTRWAKLYEKAGDK